MSEKRFLRAGKHALVLLGDIVDSTSHMYAPIVALDQLAEYKFDKRRLELLVEHSLCLIGFKKHMPFGFVALEKRDECSFLTGPYLYRDYLGRGCGEYLLNLALGKARELDLKLAYLFLHKKADWALRFYRTHQFEIVSEDPEFIKRWRDSIAADQHLPPDSVLLASLLN